MNINSLFTAICALGLVQFCCFIAVNVNWRQRHVDDAPLSLRRGPSYPTKYASVDASALTGSDCKDDETDVGIIFCTNVQRASTDQSREERCNNPLEERNQNVTKGEGMLVKHVCPKSCGLCSSKAIATGVSSADRSALNQENELDHAPLFDKWTHDVEELKSMLIEAKNEIGALKSQNEELIRQMRNMNDRHPGQMSFLPSITHHRSNEMPPRSQLQSSNDVHNVLTSHEQQLLDQSMLILMNVKIHDEDQIAKELSWIREDYSAVCSFHTTCHWFVNLVATNLPLMETFQQAASELPSGVKWFGRISSKTFNKFIFVQKHIDDMLDYDLVLFKDNDQRIMSFSWPTFIEKRANAVISGPLRRTRCDTDRKMEFQFYEACNYESPARPSWAADMYDNVNPVQVPFLEMYFVLMDGKFANFFFNLALRNKVINKVGTWGPDFAWCSAAQVWDNTRPGCYLVPVVSIHEDTRQIEKTEEFRRMGEESVRNFVQDPIVGEYCFLIVTIFGFALTRTINCL